jgi:general stress protein YciG
MTDPKEPEGIESAVMSVQTAGRKGGVATKKNMTKDDPDYYKRLGRLGGEATKKRYAGTEHYAEIGEQGGKNNAVVHDKAHFEKIGALGGEKVRKMLDRVRDLPDE